MSFEYGNLPSATDPRSLAHQASHVRASLEESISVKEKTVAQADLIVAAANLMLDSLHHNGTVFFVGNGGSAADCQHIATELVGRFERDNRLPAIALTTDSSTLTALANDFGYDTVFSRQVEALVRPGDCLIAISTSGKSVSVNLAVQAARAKQAHVIGLTGKDGGTLKELCDVCIVVPSSRTCRIQETHIAIGHIFCELIEEQLSASTQS